MLFDDEQRRDIRPIRPSGPRSERASSVDAAQEAVVLSGISCPLSCPLSLMKALQLLPAAIYTLSLQLVYFSPATCFSLAIGTSGIRPRAEAAGALEWRKPGRQVFKWSSL